MIGAGPAGCTAAKTLAEKGNTVLLVEKFKMPRYKSCSGVLIKKSMDLIEAYFGEKVPASAMCTPTQNRGMIFTDDRGKAYPPGWRAGTAPPARSRSISMILNQSEKLTGKVRRICSLI